MSPDLIKYVGKKTIMNAIDEHTIYAINFYASEVEKIAASRGEERVKESLYSDNLQERLSVISFFLLMKLLYPRKQTLGVRMSLDELKSEMVSTLFDISEREVGEVDRENVLSHAPDYFKEAMSVLLDMVLRDKK